MEKIGHRRAKFKVVELGDGEGGAFIGGLREG